MKAIQLKSITLRNWRGEKERTTQFHTDGTVTRICGRNGLGKSRHMDAFCWLLFGKDSKDRKDFNLRTTDEKGNPLQHCECSVEGTLVVDGTEITIKREYKEQWVKPRGQVEEVFKGNVTECTWDGVPVRVNEYKERINAEIIDENLFKMLTNTEYFLSLKQDVQREVLMSIAGAKTDNELAQGNAEFTALVDMLSGKSLADYRRQIAAEKKRLKMQADEIKPRIDQTDKMKPEAEDWNSLEEMLTDKKKELEEINELLHSEDARKQSAIDKKAALNREKRQIEQQQKDILAAERRSRQEEADKQNETRNEIEKELKNIHSERSDCNIDITRAKERIKYLNEEITRTTSRLEELRSEWASIRATQYTGDNICPHCGQPLPDNMIQDVLQKFEEYKQNRLKENQSRGKSLSTQVESYREELNRRNEELVEHSKKITAIDECIAGLYDRLKSTPKAAPSAINENELPAYAANLKRLDEIEKEIANITYTQTDTELSERAELVKSAIKNLEIQLNNRTIIANYDKEIERLEKEGRELAQKIADIEKREYIAAKFAKARIDDCESRLNSLFGMVHWKLFDTTLDGNEYEVCIPIIDGVSYGTCNTAKQVNAGIDITNTLARHYEVYAPMFIDRAESVNTFIASNAQMIFLQVTTDSQLTVKSEAEAVANCVIAFDVATRIGASPLMVMQNLYIVYGRPSWSSKFLIATINTCGRFEPLKFELTSNGVCNNGVANVKCVAWTTPKGVTHDENGKPVTSKSPLALRGTAVTIQMAIDEGWYSKNGSKWRTMPEQMLRYRAASFWCSTYSPELSMGMRTVEENVEDADYVDVTEQVAKEISTQANKGTISFDDAVAPVSNEVPAGVDPETGEIKEPQGETSTENQASTEDDGPGY